MATAPATSPGSTDPGGLAGGPAAGPRLGFIRLRKKSYAWALFCLMVVVAVNMLDHAFRSAGQFDRQAGHSLAGWRELFANLPVASQMLNSTLVCAAAIAIILAVSTTSGFAFAKLRYRGSGIVFLLVVSALMVPLQSIIIPEYVNLAKFNLTSSYAGAVLVYAALGTPFATFLMATYYRGISDDLIEAAVMDGLGYERTFLRIAIP